MSTNIITLITNTYPIITYDDWIILKHKNDDIYYSYDVKDNCMYIVKMVNKIPSEDYQNDIVDFGGNYDGITDDTKYCMSFNIIGKVE